MPKKALIPLLFLICLFLAVNFARADDYEIHQQTIDYTNGLSNRNPARITVWDNSLGNTTELIVYAYSNSSEARASGMTTGIDYEIKIYDENLTLIDTETFSASKEWFCHHDYIAIIENAEPDDYLDGFWIIGVTAWTYGTGNAYYYHYAYAYFYNYTSKTLTELATKSLDRWKYINAAGCKLKSSGLFSNTIYISNTHYVLGYIISEAWWEDSREGIKQEMFIFKLTPSSASIVNLGYGQYYYNDIHATFMLPLPSNPDILGIMIIGEDSAWIYSYCRSTNNIIDSHGKSLDCLDDMVSRQFEKIVYDNYRRVSFTKVRHLQTSSTSPNVLTGALPFASVGMGKSALMWFDMLIYTGGTCSDIKTSAVYYISTIVYQVDLYGSQISATYWYNALTGNIFVANYQEGTVVTQTVDLGDLEPTESFYIIGLQTLFKCESSKVIIYVLGEPIEEPPYVPAPEYQPTNPESPTWGTEWTYTAVALSVPFLFMFVPAMLLGEKAGVVGFLVGLCLSITVMYLAGLLPLWAVFLAGLGIVALIFFGRERIIGGSI